MKEKKIKFQQFHPAVSRILSSRRKNEELNFVKNVVDFNTLCSIADNLSNTVKPILFTLFGNPLPRSISDLGISDTLYKPKSLIQEMNWLFVSVRKYTKELSIFLVLKKDFEKAFLRGMYEKAENILGKILIETGYSLWYLEAKFLLLEYQNRSEEQKEFLSEINILNKKGRISTIAQFLSFRTERNLSAYKYDYDINSVFKNNKNKFEKDIREYYLFRLNFYENYSLDDFSHVLLFENSNSIVDRYLVLRDVLKVLCIQGDKFTFLQSKAKYLYKKTNDEQLLSLLFALEPENKIDLFYNSNYLHIIDLYYSGFYKEAINEIREYFLKNSVNIDFIVIYANCHISLNKDYTTLTNEKNSLLDQIGIKIFNLISNRTDRKALLYSLYQINKNLLSFDVSAGIDYLLKEEQNLIINKRLKLLSLTSFDPYFSNYYLKEANALKFLEVGLKKFSNSVAIKFHKSFLSNELMLDTEISKQVYLINKAKLAYKNDLYFESIEAWGNIIAIFSDNASIVQTALKFWFRCLIKMELYNEAIEFFVNHYLNENNSVLRIETKDLIDVLRKNRYKNIKRAIDLPIFISLTSDDDIEISFILEQFCKIYDKKRPSQLFDEVLDENDLKIELFYNNVCRIETLKHSIHINNTIERLTERINIVNHLIEIVPARKDLYDEELKLITNELIVYEGTQKLEESKIYANDQAIINNELNEIEGLFNRYKTIYRLFLKNKTILIISQKSYAMFQYNGGDKYNESEVKYTDSALAEVFAELFDSILDKYLFSKFGIVAYLSTRIRHGVLLGEIRPEIEKQNLILNTFGEKNEYQENRYWRSATFNLSSSEIQKLYEILSKFSLSVDNIIEKIIKEKIQIKKDGKNENGLFNYEFDKSELYNFAVTLSEETDAKIFCQKVIDLIWLRTDANLEVIRSYIDKQIKDQFSEELNKLERNLRQNFANDRLPQIFTNVNECNTIIENRLNKISSWFRRSGSTIDDFDVNKLINIVWKNTERCYPKVMADFNITLNINPTIKSSLYIHFTDLFRILIDNMFKYGTPQDGLRDFQFICSEDNGFMICDFISSKTLDIIDLPFKQTTDGKLIVDDKKLISEGKSGISKAIKIVQYDLENERNHVKIINEYENKFHIQIAIQLNQILV
ncbi:hypothetical protein [Mucilaginibacter xinganensis]|uniref:Uncharacterized protein n=1 Tax=Mucilaginibacter xinganensis TaxID=1234841 RepID=A0A223NYJ0_9SPHI|nr:hypothetical protein [Mucilaginibacter xinganensis]ASU34949.1 hypothetical protein MuYL_3064 [Mucilaginibacter xinganensis]